jgi:hypothetical protein
LGLHLVVKCIEGDGHLVDGVRALLDEIFHDSHALVVRLLETGNGVLKLLDLGLQLHHVLINSEGSWGAEQGSNK